jgi:hypothetical protein
MSPVSGAQTTTAGRRFERLTMRETMATVLIVTAIIALATTSLIQGHEPATAQSVALAAPAPSRLAPPLSVPLDSGEVGPFSFGYLVFESDPAHGVPGFGPLPSGGSAR